MRTRTPEQIIGKDRMLQLIFEGYAIVPATATDEMMRYAVEKMDAEERRGMTIQEWYQLLVEGAGSGQTQATPKEG